MGALWKWRKMAHSGTISRRLCLAPLAVLSLEAKAGQNALRGEVIWEVACGAPVQVRTISLNEGHTNEWPKMALNGNFLGGRQCHLARPEVEVARAQTSPMPSVVPVESTFLSPSSGLRIESVGTSPAVPVTGRLYIAGRRTFGLRLLPIHPDTRYAPRAHSSLIYYSAVFLRKS
jgi:hypothetical protein